MNIRSQPTDAAIKGGVQSGGLPNPIAITLYLSLLTALGPFAFYLIVPLVPLIGASFDAPLAGAQLIISLSAVTVALASLVHGQLADRLGRRQTVLLALSAFLLGGALTIAAPTIEILLIGRALQAAGGAVGLVLARVLLTDLFEGAKATQLMGLVNTSFVVLPMLAPLIGSLAVGAGGLSLAFALPVLLAAVLLAATPTIGLPGRVGDPLHQPGFLRDVRILMRSSRFLLVAGNLSFSIASYYVFVACAPRLVTESFGDSAHVVGVGFLVVGAAFASGNSVASRLARLIAPNTQIVLGSVGAAVASCSVIGLAAFGTLDSTEVFAFVAFMTFSQGVAAPPAAVLLVTGSRESSGNASGFAMFLEMALAGLAAQAFGSLAAGGAGAMPLAVGLAACNAAMLLTALGIRIMPEPAT